MKTLSRDKEQRVIKAAERVVDLVNEGQHPNDALFKVAMDESLPPEFVKRLTEVFNTSRQLAHFKTASADARADSFPLADSSSVLRRMYPPTVQAAGAKAAGEQCHSVWFGAPPNFTSAPLQKTADAPTALPASHDTLDLPMLTKRARNYVESVRRSAEVATSDVAYHKEMVRCAVVKAAEYFRSLEHVPFAAVESNVLTEHGAVVKPLMNAVFMACKGEVFGEKRGEAHDSRQLFDSDVEPYTTIKSAVRWAGEWRKSASEEQNQLTKADMFQREFDARLKKLAEGRRERIPFPFADIEKTGGLGKMVPMVASTAYMGNQIGSMFDDPDPRAFESQVDQAIDPEQDEMMRAARTKAMLNEFMTQDPVISGYDPNDVLTAYNEISQMTPRVAEQPAVLRGMLSRRLEVGRSDPFEAEQAIKAETGLKKIEE